MGEKYDFDAPRWLDLMLEETGKRFDDDDFFDRDHPEHERDGLIEHYGLGSHFSLADLSTSTKIHHSYESADQSTLSACSHGSTLYRTGHQHVSHRPGRLPRRLPATENDDGAGSRSNKLSPYLHRLEFSVPEELGESFHSIYRNQNGACRDWSSEESLPDPELFAILTAHNSKITLDKKNATNSRESGNISTPLISHNHIFSSHKINGQMDASRPERKNQRNLTSASPSAIPWKERENGIKKRLPMQKMLKPVSTDMTRQGKLKALRGTISQPSSRKENTGRNAFGAQRLGQPLATAPPKPTASITVKTLDCDNLQCFSAGRALKSAQGAGEPVAFLKRPQHSLGKELPTHSSAGLTNCAEAFKGKPTTPHSLEPLETHSGDKNEDSLKMFNSQAGCKKSVEAPQGLQRGRNGKGSVKRVPAHRPPLHDKNHQTYSLSKPNQVESRAIQSAAPNTTDPDDDYLKSLLAWHNARVIKPSHKQPACSGML